MRRTIWRIARAVLVLSGVLLLGVWYLYVRDYSRYFSERKGEVSRVSLTEAGIDPSFLRSWLTLESTSGLNAECGMLTPLDEGIYPAIIVLGGKATGKHAIDYAFDVSNVIIVALDYPYEPPASYTVPSFVADVPDIRSALVDMVPSTSLLIDYLLQHPGVDTSRIVLLGYSFGAPLVPAIAAHERRVAAAVMVYGGGDLQEMIRHNVQRYENRLVSELVAGIGSILLSPLEPMRYAERISPTPLVMINGLNDEQIPRENTVRFYEAAGEPKQIVWLESGHVNQQDEELSREIIRTLKQELAALGVLPIGTR